MRHSHIILCGRLIFTSICQAELLAAKFKEQVNAIMVRRRKQKTGASGKSCASRCLYLGWLCPCCDVRANFVPLQRWR